MLSEGPDLKIGKVAISLRRTYDNEKVYLNHRHLSHRVLAEWFRGTVLIRELLGDEIDLAMIWRLELKL